jgi:DNA-binding MarR family transcriptional regulator
MELPDDDRRLFFLLDRAAHQFRERVDAFCRARLGISAVQLVALMHLAREDGARAGQLAGAIGVGANAVTGLVDRMEAAGLVKRRADRDDARAQRIHLTAAGRRAVDQARPLIGAANRLLGERFTRDELAIAARFLRTVGELDLATLAPPEGDRHE